MTRNYLNQSKTFLLTIAATAIFSLAFTGCSQTTDSPQNISKTNLESDSSGMYINLPQPSIKGTVTLEETLAKRRSRRDFQDTPLSKEQISQFLWAAYGITNPKENNERLRGGFKTAPSAGALYPLNLYILIGNVKGINPGFYKYHPVGHKIEVKIDKDLRKQLAKIALNQEMIAEAPASLLYSAVFSRTTNKYGDRGRERYVCMDLGHSAQNVYLQAEALNLGTCAIGAFNDEKLINLVQLPVEEEPLYIMPVGYFYNK